MSSRTDDRPRTAPVGASAPSSGAVASPAAPAVTRGDEESFTRESLRALMSSQERGGRWEPAEVIQAQAFMGSIRLDFRNAELPPDGVVEIDAVAMFASIEIIVPDGAEIEIDGTPIMGSIEHHVRKKSAARETLRKWVTGEGEGEQGEPPEPPLFRIDAHAICASIKVSGR